MRGIIEEATPRAESVPGSKESETQSSRVRYHVLEAPRENRPARFLHAFATVLRYSGYQGLLAAYSRLCAGCVRCAPACHVYLATGEDRDLPCLRTRLLLDIYRTHFTLEGQLKSLAVGGRPLRDSDLDRLAESLYRCQACRRCWLECPMGIDHGLMTHLGRYLLSEVGLVPKALQQSALTQLHSDTHSTTGLSLPALLDSIQFMERELKRLTGREIKFPLDQPGRDLIFFAPASDFIMEAETLMGLAALLHAAGWQDRWTLGTQDCDAMNFGLYYSDWVLDQVVTRMCQEANRLKAGAILIGECGHASRTAKEFVPVFGRNFQRPVFSVIELTARLLAEGKIRLDPHAVPGRITYHDPCHLARAGWIVDQPRYLLRQLTQNFVEMTPNGRGNFCCGGGGGAAVMDEIYEFRMRVGRVKAEQLRATAADLVVAPCAECKKQLRELVRHYGLGMQVVGLHDLLLQALRWE